MKNITIFLFVLIVFSACKKNEEAPVTEGNCEKTAYFLHTQVCGEGAGIKVDEDGTLTTYIAQNFEDFFSFDEFTLDDEMTVEFEIIGNPPPGLLCGPLIVAPTIELSCLEKME